MSEELKPCPFCGSNEIYSSPHIALIVCKKCRCWGPNTGTTEAEAVSAWNRRINEKGF